MEETRHSSLHQLSTAGVLVSLGIIYGDIGTSPLYVFKAIIETGTRESAGIITADLVLGGVSCVFWTLTLITSLKYIFLALNADNKGEGGIFALYALVRRYKAKWVIYAAIIGCCTLIADGFITPAISISSAVEGVKLHYPGFEPQPFVIGILFLLFFFQQFGTSVVGKTFGPIMMIWFLTIGAFGVIQSFPKPNRIRSHQSCLCLGLAYTLPQGVLAFGCHLFVHYRCRSTVLRPGTLREDKHPGRLGIC